MHRGAGLAMTVIAPARWKRSIVAVIAAALLAPAAACSSGPAKPDIKGLDGLQFTNVTAQAGLADVPQTSHTLYYGGSMTGGVAACDFFGNGRIDLYVTRVGHPNELFRNNGNGTFTDVAKQAGVQGPDWKQGYPAPRAAT